MHKVPGYNQEQHLVIYTDKTFLKGQGLSCKTYNSRELK